MTEQLLIMSQKELDRMPVIQQVIAQRLSPKAAAHQLALSSRHLRRLIRRYQQQGAWGLVSGRCGGASNHRLSDAFKQEVLALVSQHDADFGPTLASEKLSERHALSVSRETLRQWMMSEGLWQSKRRKPCPVHQPRERRSRLGELIQIDGSPHDWFEGRSPPCPRLVFIDDATGRLLYLRFVAAETTRADVDGLEDCLKRFGRPVSIDNDRHSIFRINTLAPLSGNTLTQFGRMLKTLDIDAIHAHTPQAKGRVERANQTLQDRLVKE